MLCLQAPRIEDSVAEVPPPFSKNCLGVAAGVEHGQQPDFRLVDDVEQAARETLEVQTADIGKADGVKRRVAQEAAVMGKQFTREFQPQSGLLVFVPVDGLADVSTNERMPSQRAHP